MLLQNGHRVSFLVFLPPAYKEVTRYRIPPPRVCLFFLIFILAVLGLRCFFQAFSSCGQQKLLSACGARAFIAVSSLVAEPGLSGMWVQ